MRKRLPAYPFVTVKGPFRRGAPTPVGKTAGARRSRTGVPSRRTGGHTRELWKAVWCGLISCGIGTYVGAWEMRRWLSKAVARNGWLETARTLKGVCGELRAAALEQRKASLPSGSHFPLQLLRWLDRRLSLKGKLAFSRIARALPCAPQSVIREAVDRHVNTLSSRHVTPPRVLEEIKQHVYTLLRGKFQNCTSFSVPSSSSAVVEAGRAAGGYNSYVAGLARPAWLKARGGARAGRPTDIRDEPSKLARAFEDTLNRKISRAKYHLYPTISSAERNMASATSLLLRQSVGERVVHHASVIAELGMKARIITIPPAALFARGDLVRQVIWRVVQDNIAQILPYAPHTEDAILARLGSYRHASKVFLSADLTCATDGFGHDAIVAVCDGLRKAGLPDFLYRDLRESLGVGQQPHYVRYRLSDMSESGRRSCRARYTVVDGAVEVPKSRGSLMGTPCSFLILSLLNHFMSDRLGPPRIICGDDLAAVTHRDNVPSYAQRARDVGSELHEGKSYRSKVGFVFCEAYALSGPGGVGLLSFRPPSLKEFVRGGNGVMSQHSVDSSSFNRLARCARTIYRKQRLVATKKGRVPELPAILGGLGHPCKGRLKVPRFTRLQVGELYLCENAGHNGPHDPTKYTRPLLVPAIPQNRKEFRRIRGQLGEVVSGRVVDDPQPGDGFISNRDVDAYVSMCTNVGYLAAGEKFKRVRAQDIKPGKQTLPSPQAGCLWKVLSTHTRIRTILEWDRRARCELGVYFPAAFSAHVRARTHTYREGDLPGDVGS
nr:MAG: RNA dependent RNA polymerase [Ustilaginoidea virens narnavirus 2]